MILKKGYSVILLGLVLSVIGSGMIFPAITIAKGVDVKILYDFSGSMYPGYPDHRLSELGVNYFHQYDHFRQWLASFVAVQTRFNAKSVSMSTFSSGKTFQPGDIELVHPPVKISQFDVNKAFSKPRPKGIDYTYLAESLDHFTRKNFEGLVWMITDNRVEPGEGSGSTRDFFISLRDTKKYRSIHIYKLPFDDRESGQHADLAIYGILVSPKPVPHKVSRWYDQRFFELKNTFKERQHLKLKDLSVEPIQINIEPIEVDIEAYKKGFTEGKVIKLPLGGTIKSNLTQHTIVGGALIIETIRDFVPDSNSQKKYGIEKIPWEKFKKVTLPLPDEIPPGGIRELKQFYLESKEPVSLSLSGLGTLIKAATSGVRVKYSSKGVVSSDKIDVTIKQEGKKRLTGIYSSGDIEPIFGAQSTITEIKAKPSGFNITFILKSDPAISFLFLLFFLLLLVPFILLGFLMSRKESYKLKKGANEEMVSIRRWGRCHITQDGLLLGILRRGIGNVDHFTPNSNLASLTVTAGKKDGEFKVEIDEKEKKKVFTLSIEPVNTSRSIVGKFDADNVSSKKLNLVGGKKPPLPGPGASSQKLSKKVVITPPK